ncbi:hypothetical protein [Pseudobacteriovorax antillogorgiicola]|uniref:Uncharacterized protein n=1 Tax=Pseudobacteriovorax antillogorgiicola TaxID=1513793 RepID=A0A1Y6BLF2_9BACT|nr:hypothetical protein [Pseudobacteriovorax antillogorgiicola]TCS54597.1 hypothetical protein EDD56_106110 [Pseudobacteriovorax antillogorgiicola]SMF17677.1 hypothetical protein SAMN06296036_106133 [Pseudobacteriovorax antillogorgiicola]
MCIICLEFNKRQDFVDADRMIEAARREANAISEDHLNRLEKQLEKMKDQPGKPDLLQIDD